MKKPLIFYISIIVALLNMFDAMATYYGLTNQYIEESNPMMASLWTVSPLLFLIIKLLLSIVIIFISVLVAQYSRALFQRLFSYALFGLCILYSSVFFMHIYWITFV